MGKQDSRHALLRDSRYPIAAACDPAWQIDNAMGSPCLMLAESLSRVMTLQPGMRVLDMGCGTALTSIFFAKEFGVRVYAADLWIDASENWQRICEAGVEGLVTPLRAEAHALPFAAGFFDAIISINSLQFFGTANNYLTDHMAHLLRPDGQFGVMVFGPRQEFCGPVPPALAANWWPDFYYFHSAHWWRWHFEQTRLFSIEMADDMEGDGNRVARVWEAVMDKMDLLRQSDEDLLTWNRLVARRNSAQADDFRISR